MTIRVVSQRAIAELAAEKPSAPDTGLRVEIELKDGKAPGAFRIFRAGENTSTKGTYIFDASSQSACLAHQAKRGMDTMVDYEHASAYATFATDPQKAGRAAAWCKLECKNGELWATKVDWTEAGRAAVESKEQRFFSPVFAYNRESMVIGECLSIGLTSTPALDNLQPLAAKDGLNPEQDMEELKRMLAELAKTMMLKADASQTEVLLSIAQLRADNERLLAAIDAKSTSEALGKVEALKANAGRVVELTATIAKAETDGKKARVGTMIEAALTAKKVTPAQRPFLETMGTSDEAQLKAYLETLTPIAGAAAHTPSADGTTTTPAGTTIAALTAEQQHVAKILGFDRDAKKLEAYGSVVAQGIKVNPSLKPPTN